MKFKAPFRKKENPKPPVSDILKTVREENRRAAVNARIAIAGVATSGAASITALLEAAQQKTSGALK